MILKVTVRMNEVFIRDISKEEVKEAIFLIKVESVLGSDGMSGLFF